MAMEIGEYPLVYNDHEFWSKFSGMVMKIMKLVTNTELYYRI